MAKNNIPKQAVEQSELLGKLLLDRNNRVIEKDSNGNFHFNAKFRNAKDLKAALNRLDTDKYGDLVEREFDLVLETFESVFNHKAFTGRSGTFYGYEGLGSIYWHMVSKLLLAVQDCCIQAYNEDVDDATMKRLINHYYEINKGIGVNKPPELYGAFPTDPYSHTPAGRGAQQPGMTGQVKEDILCRFGELGVFVQAGSMVFVPFMLRKTEFVSTRSEFVYIDLEGQEQQMVLEAGDLAFTYCQVPVIYRQGSENRIEITMSDGSIRTIENQRLGKELSQQIFLRNGKVDRLTVYVDEMMLN
jgi:hypothetical protein